MTALDSMQGYVTDASYTSGFFRELSPAWLNYVAALNGVSPPRLDEPFRYLELGCAFGSSVVTNAGAFPHAEFHACDFNPDHIAGARRHADALGIANIEFHETSFHGLLAVDLPPFDFIVLHGVYSWVGAEARESIRRLIERKLRPGGLAYVSYNCQPGWAAEVPLRKLLMELAATASGNSLERAQYALGFLSELSHGTLRYFSASPPAVAAVDSYRKSPIRYIVHEFLNDTWEPFFSVDVAGDMAAIGARFVGSATLADNHPQLVVDDQAAAAVARLDTERQRRLAMDFAANQRFRRDVFVADDSRHPPADVARSLEAVAIGALGNPEHIGTKIAVPRGAVTFQAGFIRDLQTLMTRGSLTVGDAVRALTRRGTDAAAVTRNVMFLVAAGALMPFARPYARDESTVPGRPANAIVERAITHVTSHRAPVPIPSEVYGNGVPLTPTEALAITEILGGAGTVDLLAARLEAGELAPLDARRVALDVFGSLIPTLMRLGVLV